VPDEVPKIFEKLKQLVYIYKMKKWPLFLILFVINKANAQEFLEPENGILSTSALDFYDKTKEKLAEFLYFSFL
jgi:hypothetical protein